MGYEVLDAGGGRTLPAPPTGGVVVPLEPVPLEPMPLDPAPLEPVSLGPVPLGPAPPVTLLGRAHRRVCAGKVTGQQLVAVAAGCLAVGAFTGGVVGALVGHRQAVQAQVAADEAAVAAVAYATDVTRYAGVGGQTALLNVQLTNAGPRPLTLVVTPYGVDASVGHPVVRELGSTPAVPAGRNLEVLLTVSLDCVHPAANVATVPVRTADGRVHRVPVRSRTGPLDLTTSCATFGHR